MHRSKIEWCQNPDGSLGWVWNPLTGCLNGCSYCYARKLANTRLKERYLANHYVPSTDLATENTLVQERELTKRLNDPFYPRFWEERFRDFGTPNAYGVQKVLKPKGIFVCDMSDLFGIGVPEAWTENILNVIADSKPTHRFYLLTKQPQNLIKFSPFPDNCWVGQSITGNDGMFRKLEAMWKVKAGVRFLSFEPLLDLPNMVTLRSFLSGGSIKWVIIGACTGNITDLQKLASEHEGTHLVRQAPKWTLQPKIEWVREIVEAADKAGIPVFLKNNLKPLFQPIYEQAGCIDNYFTGVVSKDDIPELRQEMPNTH
ncbi:hypothetical protein LCGC14_1498370 [marine sediment metagenome]|uniref:DUF5131 family protein n=1 Tax=marine sediment metagenome TaxID=412755 RepID=A0A0F9J4R7_9ZZZZ